MKTIVISISKAVCIQACMGAMLQVAVNASWVGDNLPRIDFDQMERRSNQIELENRLRTIETRQLLRQMDEQRRGIYTIY